MSLIDILIITPLDEEWRQARSVLAGRPNEVWDGPITYYLWRSKAKKPQYEYLVAATSMGKMGIGGAAGFSQMALQTWDPYSVFLLGIAGSLKPAEILLGDVVVSEEVFGYEVGEISSDNKFKFRPTGHQVGALLLDRARALRNDPAAYLRWQSACVKAAEREKDLGPLPRAPEIHFGVTASGNLVVKAAAFREELRDKLHPKVCAVEMEAKGIFISVNQLEHKAKPLVVRGISDYADENKSKLEDASKDAWRRFACGNAARFLKYLLARKPFDRRSPSLNLNLVAQSPRLLLEHGMFTRDKGAVNLAFEGIFGEPDASPGLRLEVLGFSGSNPTSPVRSLSLLWYKDQTMKIEPHAGETGAPSFDLPRSHAKRRTDLLLSFKDSVDRVIVSCRDEFGRESRGEWH